MRQHHCKLTREIFCFCLMLSAAPKHQSNIGLPTARNLSRIGRMALALHVTCHLGQVRPIVSRIDLRLFTTANS